jgi:hypothetical protein
LDVLIATLTLPFSYVNLDSLSSGIDKGGYYHELFLRGKRFLTRRIPRIEKKGTGPKKVLRNIPDFYALPIVPTLLPTMSLVQLRASHDSTESQLSMLRNLVNGSSEMLGQLQDIQCNASLLKGSLPYLKQQLQPPMSLLTASSRFLPRYYTSNEYQAMLIKEQQGEPILHAQINPIGTLEQLLLARMARRSY